MEEISQFLASILLDVLDLVVPQTGTVAGTGESGIRTERLVDPALDLSCHDFVGWMGLVPCLGHLQRILELGGVFGGWRCWDLFGVCV